MFSRNQRSFHASTSLLILFTVLAFCLGQSRAAHSTISYECTSDSDCFDTWEQCDLERKVCKHKSVFPINNLEFGGFVLIFLQLWLANVGGIGGGGVVVPIAMLFFKFDAKNAIALSNISIFLSSLMRFFYNAKRPHPLKNGKGLLVDHNLAILMLPLIVSGSSIGVILNILLPNLVIIFTYTFGLSYLGYGVFKKTMALYRKEVERDKQEKIKEVELQDQNYMSKQPMNQHKQVSESRDADREKKDCEQKDDKQKDDENKQNGSKQQQLNKIAPEQNEKDPQQDEEQSVNYNHSIEVLNHQEKSNGAEQIKLSGDLLKQMVQAHLKQKVNEELNLIIEAESTNFQWTKLVLNWTLIIVLTVISFFKGGSEPTDSLIGVIKCDSIDWVLFTILQVICAIYLALGIVVLKRDYKAKSDAGYQFIEGDLKVTNRNISVMILVAMLGAIYAAFSGIGAGMVFVPALIMINIESQVATATGMYLSMFTTLSSTIQMIAHQKIDLEYSLYVLIMTILGTIGGLYFQRRLVDYYKRVSYQNFILVFIFALAVLSTVIVNIPIIIHTSELGQDLFTLTDYCN